MKTYSILLATLLLVHAQAFAQGQSGAGGGDQCKNEIDKHRLQIKGWIERDEAKDLDFKQAQVSGLDYATYKSRMLTVLAPGKVIVTCVNHELLVDGSASACINYEDQAGRSHIDCNYDVIMNENSLGNPNYINTHHEYASIAGLEQRASQPSDMSISKQLSQYEKVIQVKVLGPKRSITTPVKLGMFSKEKLEERKNACLAQVQEDFQQKVEKMTGYPRKVTPNQGLSEAPAYAEYDRWTPGKHGLLLYFMIDDSFYVEASSHIERRQVMGFLNQMVEQNVSVDDPAEWRFSHRGTWIFKPIPVPELLAKFADAIQPATYDSFGGIATAAQKVNAVSELSLVYPTDYQPRVKLVNRETQLETQYDYSIEAYSACMEKIVQDFKKE